MSAPVQSVSTPPWAQRVGGSNPLDPTNSAKLPLPAAGGLFGGSFDFAGFPLRAQGHACKTAQGQILSPRLMFSMSCQLSREKPKIHGRKNIHVTFIWKSAVFRCTIQFPHCFENPRVLKISAQYRLLCFAAALLLLAGPGFAHAQIQREPPTLKAPATQAPASSHVFLIVLENGSYSTVTNSTDPVNFMPHLIALGNTYGHATNYITNSGGSLLAYLWLSSGYCHSDPASTADCPHPPFPAGVTGLHSFGCTGGACINPATLDFWPITDDNIYREMINHSPNPIPWKLYAESIPFAGYTGPRTNPPDPSSGYDPHHNGPLWYSDVGRDPAQHQQQLNMVPFTQFAPDLQTSQLPQYSIILPDNNHDGHDGTPQVADQWLQANVFSTLLSQPFFQPGGDGVLIVTFDNQDDDGHGLVYWAVIGPQVKPGYISNTLFHHEDTLLTILQSLGITARPGYTAIATGMGEFFVQPAPPTQHTNTR